MKLKQNNVLNFASYSYRNEVRPTILMQQAKGNVRPLHIVFKYCVCVCVCVIPSEAAASLDSGACGEQPKATVAACCQFL